MKSRLLQVGMLSAAALCGCGDSGIPVVPVTGTITLNGEPVAGANLTFAPQSEGIPAAAGTTDAEGRYELQTAGATEPGAVVGSYKVSVIKLETKQVRTQEEAMSEAAKRGMLLPMPTTDSKNILPTKYLNPATSGLTATVEQEGENVFDFALVGKAGK